MISHKSGLSQKSILYTKYTFQCSLLFFLVITSIPSTFALQTDIVANPFNQNPYFQSTFQILISLLAPIFIRETFNKKLVSNPFLLMIYLISVSLDWTLTDRFANWCQDFYNDSFFLTYYKCLTPLFLIYFFECTIFLEYYLSKYLNALAMFYNFLINLIFLTKAIDKEYIDSDLGHIIMGLLIGLFVIIVFLNILSNSIMLIDDKYITKITGVKKKIKCKQSIKNDGDNDNDKGGHDMNYNASCPICLGHNYVHIHLDNGFAIKSKDGEEKKDKTNYPKCHCDNNEDCPICMSHKFIHINADKIKSNSEKNEGFRTKKETYLRINDKVSLFYYLLNFICAVCFAMVSGPSTWWSQFYLTVNSTQYSIYQNSGPDSTYSIIENVLYPGKKDDHNSRKDDNNV